MINVDSMCFSHISREIPQRLQSKTHAGNKVSLHQDNIILTSKLFQLTAVNTVLSTISIHQITINKFNDKEEKTFIQSTEVQNE